MLTYLHYEQQPSSNNTNTTTHTRPEQKPNPLVFNSPGQIFTPILQRLRRNPLVKEGKNMNSTRIEKKKISRSQKKKT